MPIEHGTTCDEGKQAKLIASITESDNSAKEFKLRINQIDKRVVLSWMSNRALPTQPKD